MYCGLPNKKGDGGKMDWHVDYFDTKIKNKTKGRSVELLKEVLTTGMDDGQEWVVDRRDEFEAHMRNKEWLK